MQALRRKQLSILAKLSAIIAGFSMSSFLEFNFDPSVAATGVLLAYGITTTLVVSPAFTLPQLKNTEALTLLAIFSARSWHVLVMWLVCLHMCQVQAAIYMCCLATCNLIQGTVQHVSSTFISEEEESHYILNCREFAIR